MRLPDGAEYLSETARLSHSTSCVPIGTEWVVARSTPSRLSSYNMMRRSAGGLTVVRPRGSGAVFGRSTVTPSAGRRESSTRSYV